MKIHRLDPKTVALEEIDGFISDLLRKIPANADPSGSDAALARLFPSPTNGEEPGIDTDWRELIEPELRELFLDATGIVQDDLKNLTPNSSTLRIPVKHLDGWIHALNQARLSLAARHEFSDKELEREIPLEGTERAFALFQIHFYGLLQEFFLRQLD